MREWKRDESQEIWRIRMNERTSEKNSGWVHIVVSGYMWVEKKSSKEKNREQRTTKTHTQTT